MFWDTSMDGSERRPLPPIGSERAARLAARSMPKPNGDQSGGAPLSSSMTADPWQDIGVQQECNPFRLSGPWIMEDTPEPIPTIEQLHLENCGQRQIGPNAPRSTEPWAWMDSSNWSGGANSAPGSPTPNAGMGSVGTGNSNLGLGFGGSGTITWDLGPPPAQQMRGPGEPFIHDPAGMGSPNGNASNQRYQPMNNPNCHGTTVGSPVTNPLRAPSMLHRSNLGHASKPEPNSQLFHELLRSQERTCSLAQRINDLLPTDALRRQFQNQLFQQQIHVEQQMAAVLDLKLDLVTKALHLAPEMAHSYYMYQPPGDWVTVMGAPVPGGGAGAAGANVGGGAGMTNPPGTVPRSVYTGNPGTNNMYARGGPVGTMASVPMTNILPRSVSGGVIQAGGILTGTPLGIPGMTTIAGNDMSGMGAGPSVIDTYVSAPTAMAMPNGMPGMQSIGVIRSTGPVGPPPMMMPVAIPMGPPMPVPMVVPMPRASTPERNCGDLTFDMSRDMTRMALGSPEVPPAAVVAATAAATSPVQDRGSSSTLITITTTSTSTRGNNGDASIQCPPDTLFREDLDRPRE